MTDLRQNSANSLLRQWTGPLTRELELLPSQCGLGQLPERLTPESTTTMVCGFCSTGCGLTVHLKDGVAVNLTPDANYPVNLGMACPKGWEGLAPLSAPDRATIPLARARPGDAWQALDWNAAAKLFCGRFQQIMRESGPESVAFLSTGQIPTEEMFLLGMVAKFVFGFVHGDSNTRQCMATAAVAYKQAFGFDAPPYTYADLEESDLLVFAGANPCIGHPILWERVLRNRRGGKIVVVDPRRTETAQAAHLHLPLRPKSDQSLFYGVTRLLLERGSVDEAFIARSTNGYAELCEFVQAFTLRRVATETGLTEAQIRQFADWIAQAERASFWWTMGVNQSYQGVRAAQSLINLALITGNIGRPGTGANSITGQCNAMGSRLFSNTSALAGGRDFANPEQRREVAELLGIDANRIPTSSGQTYDQILSSIHSGKIRGLWIIATNTAHSWIHQVEAQAALRKLDFLAVQDLFHSTETADFAHLLLPAAGWGEKEGTFINSERRIGRIRRVARAPGQALADFSIFRLLAEHWGCGELIGAMQTPEAVFRKLQELSRGQPCDITGIDGYAELEARGGVQWPAPKGARVDEQERRLFADGRFYHADGRARFLFDPPQPIPEPPDAEYPFLLITGRGTVAQWHTQTRTSKSAVLRTLYPQSPYVEVHPDDAKKLGLRHGGNVLVASRRGQMRATAHVVPSVSPGIVFVPMHYAQVNQLTLAHFDPHSRQPSYKDCAVRLSPLPEAP